MAIRTHTSYQLPSILKEVAHKFSPVRKRDSQIYVYQDDMWDLKGQFSQAIGDDSPLSWDMSSDGKFMLSLLAVRFLFLKYHSVFIVNSFPRMTLTFPQTLLKW